MAEDIDQIRRDLYNGMSASRQELTKRYADLKTSISNRYKDKYSPEKYLSEYLENNTSISDEGVLKTLRDKYRNILINVDKNKFELGLKLNYKLEGKRDKLDEELLRQLKGVVDDRLKNGGSNIKFGMPETPLTKKVFSRSPSGKRLVSVKGNPYQHFIFNGNPGEKVVDLIKLEPIKGDVNNYTRMHIGQ